MKSENKKETTKKLLGAFRGADKAAWMEKVAKDLKGKAIESLDWKTYEGFSMSPFATKADLGKKSTIDTLPGEAPFRRGNALNTLDSSWQAVQEVSVDKQTEAKARIQEAREGDIYAFKLYSWQGDAKSAAFLPIIESLDLKQEVLHLYASYEPLILTEGILDALQKQGTDPTLFTGTMTSLATDTGRISPDELLQIFEKTPHFRPLGIDVSVVDENGGTLVHQLAFALSRAVDWVTDSKMDPNRVLKALNFTFPVGSDFMLEMAKFRAFRVLFAFVASKLKGKGDVLSPFISAQSARWNKSRYDAHTNLLRCTTEAMSAIMGGAHAISIAAYDKLLGQETALSSRLARNIHHLLRHESYVDQVKDPAGGAYYVEKLTDTLIEEVWKCFQQIEEEGGYAACLKSGTIDRMLVESHAFKQGNIETRRHSFVGINQFPHVDENLAESLDVSQIGDEGPAVFERLRLQVDQWSNANEKRPQAYLLTFGDVKMRNARMRFAANLLGCAGIAHVTNNPADSLDVALGAMKSADCDAVVCCAADGDYEKQLIQKIKQHAGNIPVIVASKPIQGLQADHFIYARMNARAFLHELLEQILVDRA